MNTGTDTVKAAFHARGARWSWLVLLLGLFALFFLATPGPAEAHDGAVEVTASAMDTHSDCDHGHADMSGHCHASIACFAFAQATTSADTIDFQTADHPLPASPDAVHGRSPLPNLQPPKRSIQT
jgi:hypothetical protein